MQGAARPCHGHGKKNWWDERVCGESGQSWEIIQIIILPRRHGEILINYSDSKKISANGYYRIVCAIFL